MNKNEPSATFHEAAAYLSNASSLQKVSNNVKLELYGLFKFLTVSPSPSSSRPSLFDMTGRAKWDAWKSASNTYRDNAEAEKRYIQIARDLGWEEGASSTKPPEHEEEINWDDEEDEAGPSTSQGSKAQSGLGPSVSVLSKDDEETSEDETIHDCAVSGNITKAEHILKDSPDLSLDEQDENGYTALHLASDRGKLDVVKFLLGLGANPNIKDADEMTARELAEVAGHQEISRLLSTHNV